MSAILLVEDDAWAGECYERWLTQAGHTVYWQRDAQAAVEQLEDTSLDLVMLDLFLPFANGLQFLHFLAADSGWSRVPVVVCSSVLPPGVNWRAYGVVAALDKTTLTPRQLRQAVKDALHAKLPH